MFEWKSRLISTTKTTDVPQNAEERAIDEELNAIHEAALEDNQDYDRGRVYGQFLVASGQADELVYLVRDIASCLRHGEMTPFMDGAFAGLRSAGMYNVSDLVRSVVTG